jgi:hypothetical protein
VAVTQFELSSLRNLFAEGLEGMLRLKFGALYLRVQAEIAPTLLEPNFLARTNILSHVPPVVLQGLKLVAVGTKPQRNTLPFAVRFRQRDWHMGTSILSNDSQVGSL